jgi:hypothetical protein
VTGSGGGAPHAGLTRQEAHDLVLRERAALAAWSAALDALRSDPAWAALAGARPRGRTGELWTAARQAAEAVESMLAKANRTLAEAGDALDLGGPDDTVLIRVDRLLRGEAVRMDRAELPRAQRRPPWSVSSEPRFSLSEVKSLIESDLRAARALAADVAAVLGAAGPRLDLLTGLLGRIRAAADPRADAALLPAIRAAAADLDVLRDVLANDPLSLRTGGAGAPGSARFDAAADRLAVLHEKLASTLARRAEVSRHAADLAAAVDGLAALESHARDLRAVSALRADAGPVPAAPGAAGALRARLRTLDARLADPGQWRTVPDELAGVEADVEAARAEADRVLAWARRAAPDGDGHGGGADGAGHGAARTAPAVCVRPDCPGGNLEADGTCEVCFRAPAGARTGTPGASRGAARQGSNEKPATPGRGTAGEGSGHDEEV